MRIASGAAGICALCSLGRAAAFSWFAVVCVCYVSALSVVAKLTNARTVIILLQITVAIIWRAAALEPSGGLRCDWLLRAYEHTWAKS